MRHARSQTTARQRGGWLVLALLAPVGCTYLLPSHGGGDRPPKATREVDPAEVAVPDGYRIDVVTRDLTYPAGITFDEQGTPYVVESGFAYGPSWDTPRLLRLEPDGTVTQIARGAEAPWLGVDYHQGAFFIAEGGMVEGGRILRVTKDGEITTLVENLPGHGDHHTNGPVVGPDGMVYFGQGTATNSGVVGLDNYDFGWLKERPQYNDIPCQDIKLVGQNFTTDNPLTPIEGDEVSTGAFLPFGTASTPDQIIPGQVPCSGAVMRIAPTGGPVELVAWGFRNPFGLAFSPQGKLYVTDNGYDERGSRPVWGAADWLWEVRPGLWHGWPDFSGGRPVWDQRFDKPLMKKPTRLLAEHPNQPPMAAAYFGVHSSSNGIAFPTNDRFGFMGHAFVAQFGDQAPVVGEVVQPVGFRVVVVDPATGVITPFAANKAGLGPASLLNGAGLERPVDVGFSPSGDALYVVDFGIMTMGEEARPQKQTGVIWRITRNGVGG